MNEWPKVGDSVSFWDSDIGIYREGTIVATYGSEVWPSPHVLVQYTDETGWTHTKTVDYANVNKRDPNARCECGSDALGHPGHQSYCPKA